jgi:predicted dehydrogenase
MPLLGGRDDVELTAVCRLGQAELQQVKHRFGFKFATESAEELVNYPGLDAVFVVAPHTLHYAHARLALDEHGELAGDLVSRRFFSASCNRL